MITPAMHNDLGLLLEMMRDFYAHEAIAFERDRATRSLAELLADETLGRVFLIKRDEQAVGYLVLTYGYSLEFGGRYGLVDELYLIEAARSAGLGRAALAFAFEFCAARGVTALRLEVETTNQRACAVYERFGFARHERYLMTRPIGSPEAGSVG